MFRTLFGKKRSDFPPPRPGQTLLVVGDIHGRLDLLVDFPTFGPEDQLIFVGDYIDRGDQSADVLRMLHDQPDAVCLMGNHEEMMLKFIDAPAKHGGRWLHYGGLQTLASFGITQIDEAAPVEKLEQIRDELVKVMGPELLEWLRDLPSYWQSGNVVVTHAGADPQLSIEKQNPKHLRWGHPDFERRRRTDGLWVVHGHTIVDIPWMGAGRINVDTGAHATGRLTVATISDTGVTFNSTF